jgi:aryl-alcohol dehydrogenase-like predicted oxidoreductase
LDYVNLGRTGLKISRVVLGAATFGETADAAASTAVVGAALDIGVTTFDVADAYVQGQAEEILGAALRSRRDQVVICSKVGLRPLDTETDHATAMGRRPLDHAERWQRGIAPTDAGLSRKHILAAVEHSLRRLQTDYLDLYQIHLWDPTTPIEETLGALESLVRSGKVLHIGCSQLRAHELYRALWASEVRGFSRFESMQVPYNALQRDAEIDLFEACTAEGVSVLAFRPLAGGMLTGRWGRHAPPEDDSRFARRASYQNRFWNEASIEAVERLTLVASRFGRSVAELSLGWVLANPAVTATIFGASRPDRLADVEATVARPLSREEIAAVDEALRVAG